MDGKRYNSGRDTYMMMMIMMMMMIDRDAAGAGMHRMSRTQPIPPSLPQRQEFPHKAPAQCSAPTSSGLVCLCGLLNRSFGNVASGH